MVEVGEAIEVWYILRRKKFFKKHFPNLERLVVRTDDTGRSLEMADDRAEELNVFIRKIRQLEGQEFDIVLVNMDREELV